MDYQTAMYASSGSSEVGVSHQKVDTAQSGTSLHFVHGEVKTLPCAPWKVNAMQDRNVVLQAPRPCILELYANMFPSFESPE